MEGEMDTFQMKIGEKEIEALSKAHQEPKWLLRYRLESLSLFRKLPLEETGLYAKYTDASRINWKRLCLPKKEGRQGISQGARPVRSAAASDEGALVCSIHAAIDKQPSKMRPLFKTPSTKLEALSGAFFTNGIFICIPENTALKDPVRIAGGASGKDLLSASKSLILMERNSSATICEEGISNPDASGLVSSHTGIKVGNAAKLRHDFLSSSAPKLSVFCSRKVEIGKDASASFWSGRFGGLQTIARHECKIVGDGGCAEDHKFVAGSEEETFDVASNITHEGRNTRGKTVLRGMLRGNSSALLRGMVAIGKGAVGTNSYMAGHSMLLDIGASSDIVPGLRIENNEVKATHSASVSQIDEAQLFYLMSRGFTEKEAKKMIAEGFLSPVLAQMHSGELASRLKHIFREKWGGGAYLDTWMPSGRGKNEGFEGHYKYR